MYSNLLSPSSINTYKQCPRKFYYQYIKRLKTSDSIHLIRGSITHEVLEKVYDLDVSSQNFTTVQVFLGKWMLQKLKSLWSEAQERMEGLDLSQDQLVFYFEETRTMLRHWLMDFLKRLRETGMEFSDAFAKLTPEREKRVSSEAHNVMGFIDVIEFVDGKVTRVVDYKTSAKDKMTDDYRLQLAIYALLINETYGYPPEEVVINFLKFGERSLRVDDELMEYAKQEVAWVTQKVKSSDLADYPKKVTPLCRWENARGKGQCDFYDHCFGEQRELI